MTSTGFWFLTGQLETANVRADNLLNQLQNLQRIEMLADLAGLSESISRYQQSVTSSMDEPQKRREQLKAELEKLPSHIDDGLTRLQSQDQHIQ